MQTETKNLQSKCQNQMCKYWRARLKNASCNFGANSENHEIKMDLHKTLVLPRELLDDIKLEDADKFNEQFDKLIAKINLDLNKKWLVHLVHNNLSAKPIN